MANIYFGLLIQFKTLWEKEYPDRNSIRRNIISSS